MIYIPDPNNPGSVIGENGHSYPSNYAPGFGSWAVDEAWEILDVVKPGVISSDIRAFLAGSIAGKLMNVAKEKNTNG